MAVTQFERAGVIGTGMMGPGIAGALALGGVEAVILSRNPDSAAAGLEKARSQLALLAREQLVAEAAAAQAAARLSASADLPAAVRDASIVIESAPEDMDFKKKLFAQLEEYVSGSCILATNTSGLSITAIASACRNPERVMTTHFWNPPHLMPLVEIVLGEKTSPVLADAVRDLLARCGKTPVMVRKDRPGQLGNRLQMALVREAANIVAEGIAGVEDVDLAARTGFGLRLPVYGILEHQDMVGLDMGCRIVDYVVRDLNNEPCAPRIFFDKVARGELGVKSGKGFYDWTVKSAEEVRARRDGFLIEYLRGQKQRRQDG
ncbi:MAG: 3-hydroxyacyl-CoA dehydrogenase family protein [Bryobacterales bacterium]|nr:3-hydroxyacyl-CoA dehydrogenase family protein [Bryobacterales bacterium]